MQIKQIAMSVLGSGYIKEGKQTIAPLHGMPSMFKHFEKVLATSLIDFHNTIYNYRFNYYTNIYIAI